MANVQLALGARSTPSHAVPTTSCVLSPVTPRASAPLDWFTLWLVIVTFTVDEVPTRMEPRSTFDNETVSPVAAMPIPDSVNGLNVIVAPETPSVAVDATVEVGRYLTWIEHIEFWASRAFVQVLAVIVNGVPAESVT